MLVLMQEALMVTQLSGLTADDLAQFPDDDSRYELIGGQLHVSPAPSPVHQTVLLNIATMVRDHVRSRQLGRVFVAPIDVRLSDRDLVQPDLLFVATQRSAIVTTTGVRGAPDLVVEVVSPSSRS